MLEQTASQPMTAPDPKLTVRELMTEGVISCPRDANLAAVAATLVRCRVHGVFVLDGEGRPLGVVSDFDLLAGEWLGADPDGVRTMRTITAGDLLTAPVETIGVDATAAEAAERMRDLRVSRLLVLDQNASPLGVISVSDVVAQLGRAPGERRTIREVMSRAIVTCPPGTSLEAAARAMTERRSRSIVVTDDRGHATGVITGFDLLGLYQPGNHRETTVDELMKTPVITVDAGETLGRAADLMVTHEVHRLVVIDDARPDGGPLGIISTSDIVAEMAQKGSIWQVPA